MKTSNRPGVATAAPGNTLLAVPNSAFDEALLRSVPVEWARSHCALAVRMEGVARGLLPDASRYDDLLALEMAVGEPLVETLVDREAILDAVERFYARLPRREKENAAAPRQPDSTDGSREQPPAGTDLLVANEDAPVTAFVNDTLLDAVRKNASDLHVEPSPAGVRIRSRIDGVLYPEPAPQPDLAAAVIVRLKVMASMDIGEKRLPQDGMCSVSVGDRRIDLRVSTIPVADGERVALRILDRANSLLPLDRLGMSEDAVTALRELIERRVGLLIVSGPTGSGKTTTLYASLRAIDATRTNILTVEDPIEYRLDHIGQIQVHPRIGLTFATGLRHMLRQDPDVMLVGEIRDTETAEIAVRAALTGHLVLSTLHTNDAFGVPERLHDIGVAPYLTASALRGVVSQRLIRRVCPACSDVRPLTADEAAFLGSPAIVGQPARVPRECDQCREGYSGRVGVFELFMLDEALRDAIRSGQTSRGAMRAAALERNLPSLRDDCRRKVIDGQTTVSEVRSVV